MSIFLTIKGWFNKIFGRKGRQSTTFPLQYELVETELDSEHFRQGIKLLDDRYKDIIVTIDPKVKIEERAGALAILFDYQVESNPLNINVDYEELRHHIGQIVVDLIHKDYLK